MKMKKKIIIFGIFFISIMIMGNVLAIESTYVQKDSCEDSGGEWIYAPGSPECKCPEGQRFDSILGCKNCIEKVIYCLFPKLSGGNVCRETTTCLFENQQLSTNCFEKGDECCRVEFGNESEWNKKVKSCQKISGISKFEILLMVIGGIVLIILCLNYKKLKKIFK